MRKNLAVENPLATEIADACSSLGFKSKLEVLAAHPKDWANVGRVRIPLKDGEFGTGGREKVKNSASTTSSLSTIECTTWVGAGGMAECMD